MGCKNFGMPSLLLPFLTHEAKYTNKLEDFMGLLIQF